MVKKMYCMNCKEEVYPKIKVNWSPLSATNRKYQCPHCETKLTNKTDNFFLTCYLIIALAVGIFLLAGGWKIALLFLVLMAGGA
ncbi:MAG: hypothetical protein R3255_08575 [Candidatus Lokiarchaeia archaeon]|nr:hypothetical protein [Candidatus Lokiarchaeia archaeon]